MSACSYQTYHHELLIKLAENIKNSPPFNGDTLDELQSQFLEKLDDILSKSTSHDDTLSAGQWLLTKIVAHFQNIMPLVPRDLFWYFGGECLHFLGDEEIEIFQQADEVYHASLAENQEAANYADILHNLKQKSNKLH